MFLPGQFPCYGIKRATGDDTGAGMPREWHSEPGVDRLGEILATIFLAAILAFFLYGYLPHFL